MFFSVMCLLCLCTRLFKCALWSPAGNGLTSWLSFVVSPVKYFTDRSKAALLLWIFYVFFFCLVFVMSLCASVLMCFVVTCWERADLLALVYCV